VEAGTVSRVRQMGAGALAVLLAVAAVGVAATQDDEALTPLGNAAKSGDAAQVQRLLDEGTDPNVRDKQGRTPLFWACSVVARHPAEDGAPDYVQVASLLLDRGATADAPDRTGRTPLLMATAGAASEYGVIGADELIVRLLLAHGAKVNAQDDGGWSPLLRATSLFADQPELIPMLLSFGADVNAHLKDGRTSLMLAAELGKQERLTLLLEAHADVNALDANDDSALTKAALFHWEEISSQMMALLIDRGADLNLADRQGRTPAERAAEAGYPERVQFLLSKGADVSDPAALLAKARNYALLREISEGSVEAARSLLVQGADPNFRNSQGQTPLSIAAAFEGPDKALLLLDGGASVDTVVGGETPLLIAAASYHAATVKALLAHDANANAVDAAGNTPLLRAAASRQSWREEIDPLIGLLLAVGADVNRHNARGETALMWMAGQGNPAFLQVLAKSAEVDARDADGNTALLWAARRFVRDQQVECGRLLLDRGAEVNAANRRGETALILAATQHETEGIRLLLAKKPDVNRMTVEGRTALMQAIDAPEDFDNDKGIVYSPAIAKLLIDSGADVNAADRRGNTALSLAVARGYKEMAAELRKAGATR